MDNDDTPVLRPPLDDEDILPLHAGDRVLLSGVIYTARDMAHGRMVEALEAGEDLPFDPDGAVIYYVGPAPASGDRAVGAAGPTTSYRMDAFAPALYRAGIRATIGKGPRSDEVRGAIAECNALYLAAVGGAGALLSSRIKDSEVIAYPDLGPEAVRRLEVEDFPAIVINDAHGADLYERVASGADA